jgi:hypothetical protein
MWGRATGDLDVVEERAARASAPDHLLRLADELNHKDSPLRQTDLLPSYG